MRAALAVDVPGGCGGERMVPPLPFIVALPRSLSLSLSPDLLYSPCRPTSDATPSHAEIRLLPSFLPSWLFIRSCCVPNKTCLMVINNTLRNERSAVVASTCREHIFLTVEKFLYISFLEKKIRWTGSQEITLRDPCYGS